MRQKAINGVGGRRLETAQARRALCDIASFLRVRITGVEVATVRVATGDDAVLTLRCDETTRLAELVEPFMPGRRGAFRTANGWLGLLSRRWCVLAVPLGKGSRPPHKLPINLMFRMSRDGSVLETVPDEGGLGMALFSVELA